MKKEFSWKIWGKKLAVNAVIVIAAGLAAVYGDNPYYLAAIPVIKAIENAVKHWNG